MPSNSDAKRVDDLLAVVVPAAASLRERRDAPWLEPASNDGEDVDSLWRAWAETAAGGRDSDLRALLADRGIEPDAARAGLSGVRLVAGAELPPWADALRELLAASLRAPAPDDLALAASSTAGGALSLTSESSIRIASGFGAHALAGFVTALRSWLEPAPAVPASLPEELVGHALRWMLLVCLPVFRAGALEAFEPGRPPFDGWAATLREAPALGRALGVLAENERSFSRELLGRLEGDRDRLEPLLVAAPRVERRRPPTGPDRTRDEGRFVLPVTFEDGRRLLYKRKDLGGEGVLARIVEVLGDDLLLPARHGCDGYAWEAFVEQRVPESPAEWSELARQVGMWTRLFDLLGTNDVRSSNVRVSGSRLVPVDTETLLTVSFTPTDDLPWSPAGSSSRLLSAPLLSQSPSLRRDWGLLADPAHGPLVDHLDRALAGYAEMHSRIASSREPLHEALDELAEAPVRALVRSSRAYFALMMESLTPAALSSGVRRDLVLERLWRAQRRFGLAVAIVEAEVDSLRDLDTPLFRVLPGGRDIVGPGAEVAVSVLPEAPLDRLRTRLDALRPEPDPAELEAVAAQFFCGVENSAANRPATDLGAVLEWTAGAEVDWRAKAVHAGGELLDLLGHGAPGRTRLDAGIVYDDHNHVFVLSPRRSADVLSGSLGIAVALGDLASATAEERFAAEAMRQRGQAVTALHALADDVHRWSRTRRDPPRGGLHWGLPAVLYALLRLPLAADDEALARVSSALAGFEAGAAYRLGPWVRSTMPAALLIGTSLDPRLAAPTEALRERLASLLAGEWEWLGSDAPALAPLAGLFPSRHALAALALHRHACALGTPLPGPAAAWIEQAGGSETPADRLVALELGAEVVPREPTLPATTLGCLDVIEEQLLRWQAVPASQPLELARAAGARILALQSAHGRWFPEGVAPDRFRLSALWGVAAVARAFAGLAAPERWYSLRLLQPPASSRRAC